jgi:2-amino-4-hydroxy-6-hydroxymethyldihydropteridine diphosphokinase
MSICCIGLGGNTGPVAETFAAALRALRARGVVVRDVSRLYRTRPMGGGPAADTFLNACVRVETDLPPAQLLAVLQHIETAAGREPGERWGRRLLDLDVLLIDEQIVRTPELIVPHPGVVYRRFVLDPMQDVAADAVVPPMMRTVSELKMRLVRRPLPIALAGGSAEDRERIGVVVGKAFPDVRLVSEGDGSPRDVDATVFVLGRDTGCPDLNRAGVTVPVERGLGSLNAAVCAMLEAMLDEPECVGELVRP